MPEMELELLRQIHDRVMAIDEKLEAKVDKEDCAVHANRISKLEDKTDNLTVKTATYAGLASGIVLTLKALFGYASGGSVQ